MSNPPLSSPQQPPQNETLVNPSHSETISNFISFLKPETYTKPSDPSDPPVSPAFPNTSSSSYPHHFADVTLHVNDKTKYLVHRIVLSHYSPFFLNLFNTLSSVVHHFDVFLEGFRERDVEKVLEFMYTGGIDFGGEGVAAQRKSDKEDDEDEGMMSGGCWGKDRVSNGVGGVIGVAEVLQIPSIIELLKPEVEYTEACDKPNRPTGSSPIGVWQQRKKRDDEECSTNERDQFGDDEDDDDDDEEEEECVLMMMREKGRKKRRKNDEVSGEAGVGGGKGACGSKRKQARPKRHTPSPSSLPDSEREGVERRVSEEEEDEEEEEEDDDDEEVVMMNREKNEFLMSGGGIYSPVCSEDIEDDEMEEMEEREEIELFEDENEEKRKEEKKMEVVSKGEEEALRVQPGLPMPPPHFLFLRNIMNQGGGNNGSNGQLGIGQHQHHQSSQPGHMQTPPPIPFYPHHHHGHLPHHQPAGIVPSGGTSMLAGKRLQKSLWGKMMMMGGGSGGSGGGGAGGNGKGQFLHHHHHHHHVGGSRAQHSAPRGGPPRAWSNQDLTEALHNVWNKKMTTSQASRIFGIPYNSLLMYVRGKYGKSLKLDLLKKGLDLALLEKQKKSGQAGAGKVSNEPASPASSSSPTQQQIIRRSKVTLPALPVGPPQIPGAPQIPGSSSASSALKNFHNNNVVEWMMMNSGKQIGGGGGGGGMHAGGLFFGGGGGFMGDGGGGGMQQRGK